MRFWRYDVGDLSPLSSHFSVLGTRDAILPKDLFSFILTIDALLHRTPISRVSLRELLFFGIYFSFQRDKFALAA